MYKIIRENLPLSIIKEAYNSKGERFKIDKYELYSKDDRYLNFLKHGFKCNKCGIEGKYVNLECCRKLKNHLNVYAIGKNGEAIQLTKDHIYPKSKGGLDNIINYQVLCCNCNGSKSDNSPITLVEALRSGLATRKSVENAVKQGRPKALIGV